MLGVGHDELNGAQDASTSGFVGVFRRSKDKMGGKVERVEVEKKREKVEFCSFYGDEAKGIPRD